MNKANHKQGDRLLENAKDDRHMAPEDILWSTGITMSCRVTTADTLL